MDLHVALSRGLDDGPVHLSWRDRIEATRILTARGESARSIGLRLDIDGRSVRRYRVLIRERGC